MGALCAVSAGELMGSATCTRLVFDPAHQDHTWAQAADDGWIRTCDPHGDTLYPEKRSCGPSAALHEA